MSKQRPVDIIRRMTTKSRRRISEDQIAQNSAIVVQQAQVDYADQRGGLLRHHKQKPLHPLLRPAITITVALVGALICSASVQTATLTLPRWARAVATPIIAGALVSASEKIGRQTITILRLKQMQLIEMKRLEMTLEHTPEEYQFERCWTEAQLALLKTVEARPWPWLRASSLGLTFLVEAGAALLWVSQESVILAIFAAAFPPTYVLLASILLSHLLDGYKEDQRLARIYDEYLAPPSESVTVASVPILREEAITQPQTWEPVEDTVPFVRNNNHVPNVVFPLDPSV